MEDNLKFEVYYNGNNEEQEDINEVVIDDLYDCID